MKMSPIEILELQNRALEGKREQLNAVYHALLKLQMMGLTIQSGMVQCPPPANIHPSRWKAMLVFAVANPENL